MTAQFHEGQEIEIDFTRNLAVFGHEWHKAKIIELLLPDDDGDIYRVEFCDGSRMVAIEKHIRAVSSPYGSINNPRGWP